MRLNKTIIYIILVLLIILIIYIFIHCISLKTIQTSSKTNDVYKILVDVEESKLYLFKNNILDKTYKCAGGKYSTPSPIGTWTIVSKGTWGEGFGGSWLGFNVPWGQFGIHGTQEKYSIGWSSSHRLY